MSARSGALRLPRRARGRPKSSRSLGSIARGPIVIERPRRRRLPLRSPSRHRQRTRRPHSLPRPAPSSWPSTSASGWTRDPSWEGPQGCKGRPRDRTGMCAFTAPSVVFRRGEDAVVAGGWQPAARVRCPARELRSRLRSRPAAGVAARVLSWRSDHRRSRPPSRRWVGSGTGTGPRQAAADGHCRNQRGGASPARE